MSSQNKATSGLRERMIAEAAYFKAERRGFNGGDAVRDWCEAEAEIDAQLRRLDDGQLVDRIEEALESAAKRLASLRRKVAGLSSEARGEWDRDRERLAALRDSLKPAYAALGAPLRERFKADDLCLSRSYDAAHMAAHPKQTVKRIAVLKTRESKLSDDYPAYKLSFQIELRDGKRIEKKTDCSPDNYAYTCTHDPQLDTQRDFYLTRAGDNEVMLRDKRGVLAKLFDAKLGDDDRLFKLRASPAADCRF